MDRSNGSSCGDGQISFFVKRVRTKICFSYNESCGSTLDDTTQKRHKRCLCAALFDYLIPYSILLFVQKYVAHKLFPRFLKLQYQDLLENSSSHEPTQKGPERA